ncbi:MAG: RDD family protein [Methylocystaceae bacterium]
MEANYGGKKCPYCQQFIENEGEAIICSGCGNPHHQDCWNENGGCTTFGCRFAPAQEAPRRVSQPLRVIAPSGTAGSVICPYCRQETSRFQTKCSGCQGPLYAGFWNRVWAIQIDGFILGALLYVIFLLAVLVAVPTIPFLKSKFEDVMAVTIIIGMLFYPIALWLYNAIFESSSLMGTPGKILMAIKVTDQEGKRISFWRATGRSLATLLSYLLICTGFIPAAFTRRKQALHDIIAGTVVVRAVYPDREGNDLNNTRRKVVGGIILLFGLAMLIMCAFIFILVIQNDPELSSQWSNTF